MTAVIKIRKGDAVVDGRAYDLESCVVKSIGDAKDNRFLVLASCGLEDRDDDTIQSDGWDLEYYSKHPVLVDSHNYDGLEHQIGETSEHDLSKQSYRTVVTYYNDQGNQRADWAHFLATKGRAAFSVGFIPLKSEPRKGHSGINFLEQEQLELSQVIVPSSRQALQLMAKGVTVAGNSLQARLARELLTDFDTEQKRPKSWTGAMLPRQKWDSNFMADTDGYGYGPIDTHCIVAGCDDASQISVPICSEHLRELMKMDPEPADAPPDDDDLPLVLRRLTRAYRVKAGRQISAGNMGHLHSAIASLTTVHDAACDSADCPLDGDEGDPPTSRDKAMGEGEGSAGGVTVSDSGTHGAFTGTHTHDHADPSGEAGDTYSHQHSHNGDGDHGHTHAKAAAVAETATKTFDLVAALDAVLAGVES